MRLTGQGVSPGIGIGRALVVTRGTANLRYRIPERRIDGELARLDTARAHARLQIGPIKRPFASPARPAHTHLFDPPPPPLSPPSPPHPPPPTFPRHRPTP